MLRTIPDKAPWHANRLRLDYAAEAQRLGPPAAPIVDIHTHIGGAEACKVWDQARRLFGIRSVYTMNQLPSVEPVRDALGRDVRFIAFPQFIDPDRQRAHRQGLLEAIEFFHSRHGSRMLKLWNSPGLREILGRELRPEDDGVSIFELDSPWRVKACELGTRLGMMFMVHIADPDTWFQAKYNDVSKFGVKRDHYAGLERMLDRFTSPWIAAHMGGWPEDVEFLDGLLTRHPNLHLDTSATRWVVRALSSPHQPRERVRAFFEKWGRGTAQKPGRLFFGSDLVVMDDQLSTQKRANSIRGELSSSPEEAFELYCSRYWALRMLFESDYHGESNIADPDLKMVYPDGLNGVKFDEMSAPPLRGLGLDRELLADLYARNAERVVEKWWSDHGGG